MLSKCKTAPFLESAKVIGCRSHMVIIQIVCKEVVEFLLVDLNTDTVMGKYVERYEGKPYLFEGLVSPDLSHFILKPNLLYVLKYGIPCVDDRVRVLQPVYRKPGSTTPDSTTVKHGQSGGSILSTEQPAKQLQRMVGHHSSVFPLYESTSRLFQGQGLDLILAYDPRYKHSKVAIANLTKRTQHVICIYCLKQNRITQKVFGPQFHRTQNLVFSPDGEFLSSLIVTYILGPKMYPQKFDFLCVMIYSTDKLELLHRIKSYGTAGLTCLIPAACFPIFSTDGSRIAVGAGAGSCVNRIEVYNMPVFGSLKNLCRLRICKFVSNEIIENYNLDADLKDYLLYKPSYM